MKIYWGGADNVMCVGEAKVSDLVELCIQHSRPPKVKWAASGRFKEYRDLHCLYGSHCLVQPAILRVFAALQVQKEDFK